MAGPSVHVVPPTELDLATAGAFANDIADALSTGTGTVVVDFAAVQFCDSTGLRVLVGAAKLARARDAALVIRNPTRQLLLIAHVVGAAELLDLPHPDCP